MFSFLEGKQYQNLLNKTSTLDARVVPTKTLASLSKLHEQKNCLKLLTSKTKNGLKIMRRLSFCHLLVMYSSNYYGLVEKFVQGEMLSADEWLNQQVIKPYYFFMKKILSSTQMYNKSKEGFQTFSFQKEFYIYNILMEMFKIVAKMPLLGRYYKDNNPQIICSFVETIAVQAQKLYLPWKTGLQQLFNNLKTFIHCRGDQKLVRVLIEQCLPLLNQQMKKLFLDKYFYPYGKGIGIRLFRTQQQNQQTTKLIDGILNDHKDTERRMAQQQLQKTLFPEDGKFNYNFFEESFISGGKSGKGMNKDKKRQELQIQDEDQGEIVEPMVFEDTITKDKDQKQTSDHMQYCQDI